MAAETPVVLSHLCEMLIKDLCEAVAAEYPRADKISPADFARACRKHHRFHILLEHDGSD